MVKQNFNAYERMILKNAIKPWNTTKLVENDLISLDFIFATLDKIAWDFKAVSKRPDLRIEHVDEHPDLDWDFDHISGLNLKYSGNKIEPKQQIQDLFKTTL